MSRKIHHVCVDLISEDQARFYRRHKIYNSNGHKIQLEDLPVILANDDYIVYEDTVSWQPADNEEDWKVDDEDKKEKDSMIYLYSRAVIQVILVFDE